MIRRTFVCRPVIDEKGRASCTGGGWWADDNYDPSLRSPNFERPRPVCTKCGRPLTELAPTLVTPL